MTREGRWYGMGHIDHGGQGADASEASARTSSGRRAGGFVRHHPVVLAEQAQRAQHIQLRIAGWITAYAGSMNFVYLHILLFAIWMLFIEKSPWPS